jgi:hypothetical protein
MSSFGALLLSILSAGFIVGTQPNPESQTSYSGTTYQLVDAKDHAVIPRKFSSRAIASRVGVFRKADGILHL